ncbi:ATP-binding protein [Rhodanobacter sp. C01]|uniref:ATP-binding protein n=1 Tax=Rhodanobacter sp. C01 TaxID=1945856 RepID=UPI0009871BB1|nr:ATP-binding protein [Rhodanobacter sp. C01]OOG51582.1 hypothetical protein B0E50_00435 [Rhodanobacter sp. C01]
MTVIGAKENVLDPNRHVGVVSSVFPARAFVNLGDETARSGTSLYGHPLGTGQVGEFVLIDCDKTAVIGRVSAVRLIERDRLVIKPSFDAERFVDPIGEVDLLATVDRESGRIYPGIAVRPRLGAHVYSPAPDLMSALVADAAHGAADGSAKLSLGVVTSLQDASVAVTPERLFGRHCAILGATGGGKSYTIAKLIEESGKYSCKIILVDATGEFYPLGELAEHVSLGKPLHGETEVHLPYSALEEQDLYGLFQPSGKVQGPKLREAIYSLRIAHILTTDKSAPIVALKTAMTTNGLLLPNGLIAKADLPRKPFDDALNTLRSAIEAPDALFDVRLLATQIVSECIWPTSFKKAGCYGLGDGNEAYCAPLVARINAVLAGPDLRVIFEPTGPSLLSEIEEFLAGKHRVLRISLASVPYGFNAREIVANAIGRRLLMFGRAQRFKKQPVTVFLDEAHNFLNRKIGDDDASVRLDAFDQIAKEGRKHWLTICLATQRPRDLPEGVLSQMGTMIVHRLINDRDRDVVERACGEIDRAAVAFLPTLAPGQAAFVGVDFPFPLTVSIDKPNNPPDSRGPDYQASWKL